MVNNVINATYTETYDLNTAVNELSILGLHTPQATALKAMFKGFFQQYKKFKILGCNLQMVCASQQSLTPDLVGLEAGEVDPRDVLNPVLFKACTGEKLNALLDQIYNKSEEPGSLVGSSVSQHTNGPDRPGITDYYALLADNSWRKEHPQRGLTVMGLRPFVHKVVTTQPFAWTGQSEDVPRIGGDTNPATVLHTVGFGGQSGSKNPASNPINHSIFISDGVTEMPWLDTVFSRVEGQYGIVGDEVVPVSNSNNKVYTAINSIPRVYLGCIVLPPAIQQRLFFRMQIVWHIQFKDFRPSFEVTRLEEGNKDLVDNDSWIKAAYSTYFNIYHNPTPANLTKQMSSFDASGLSEVSNVNNQVQ